MHRAILEGKGVESIPRSDSQHFGRTEEICESVLPDKKIIIHMLDFLWIMT